MNEPHPSAALEQRIMSLRDCMEEVTQGVGPEWRRFRLVGATRGGLASAKEAIGKSPERYKSVQPGTIFYNPMRILLGSIAMIDEGEQPGITSPDYVVLRTRAKVLHHRCFYYWLRSIWGENLIRSLARGAVRERILFRRLCEGEISLPSWEVQERIAAALAMIPKLRRAAEERLSAAEALPAAYLRDVFEGPEAEGWETYHLGDVIHRHNEIIHPGDRPDGFAEFVGLEHIQPNTGRRIGSRRIDLANMTGRKPTFRSGQIVYGYLRPYLNKVWVAEFDGCSSVDQFAFEVRTGLADRDFIATFMRSEVFLRRAATVSTTGQLPRISIEEILAAEIDLPEPHEQARIAVALSAQLAAANALIARCREELAAVEALPAALLRRAFGAIV